ncbi:hypothetical protein [Geoalkalibacter halelectricus]|uniref:hypothetical protein n=1 Tax=Geoalkalibacter halelectricus TaxID=2847045 RepID=UPI00266FF998|nr:hypothetical protein [Geoalkalibacter halelectricus]
MPLRSRNPLFIAASGFTLWMLFWVPVVLWAYGPQNFLWLCNLSKFLLLYALWRGHRLIASSQAGLVCLVGVVWTLDFALGLASGGQLANFTAYMFNPDTPWLARSTSLYHSALPVLGFWLVWRLGYDRRGPWLQSIIGVPAVVGTWLWTEPERNVNWVFAPFGIEQVWLPEPLFVLCLVFAYPLLLYLPGHFLVLALLRFFARRRSEP